MLETVEELKKHRPDLVEDFEKMSRDELLNQIYLEAIDAINMEKRVSFFMENCTNGFSKTNYTLDSLESMVNDKKETDLNDFCYDIVRDYSNSDEELLEYIKDRASWSNNKKYEKHIKE